MTLLDLAVGLAHVHHLDIEDTHRTCRVFLEQIEGADGAAHDECELPDHVAKAIETAFSVTAEYDDILDAPHDDLEVSA